MIWIKPNRKVSQKITKSQGFLRDFASIEMFSLNFINWIFERNLIKIIIYYNEYIDILKSI